MDAAGLIYHPKDGKWPGLKRYAEADTNKAPQNLILSPTGFTNYSKNDEYLGYDTQKPEALLRQFVKASSNAGDVVLDPYCGCGTTIRVCRNIDGDGNAAEDRRHFIGIDLAHIAISIVEDNFKTKFGEPPQVRGSPEDMESAQNLFARSAFHFEAWAVAKVAGLSPNQKKTGDRGIDGRGWFIGNDKDKRELVLAQVKGGKKLQPKEVREFIGTIENENATLGILIVMDETSATQAAKSAAAKEEIEIRGKKYPKVQIFSAEDHFAGRKPVLPTMLNYLTGEAEGLL